MAEIENGVKYGKYANIAIILLYLPGFVSILGLFSPPEISFCFWGGATCLSSLILIGVIGLGIASLNSFNKGLGELPSDGEQSTVLPSLGLFLAGLFLITISVFASIASSKVNVLTVATFLSGCGNLAIILGFGVLIARLLDKESWKLFLLNLGITIFVTFVSMLFTNIIGTQNLDNMSNFGNSFALVRTSESFFSVCYLAPAYIYHSVQSKIVSKKIILKEQVKERQYSPYLTYPNTQNFAQNRIYYNEISQFRYPTYYQNQSKVENEQKNEQNPKEIVPQVKKIIDAKIVELPISNIEQKIEQKNESAEGSIEKDVKTDGKLPVTENEKTSDQKAASRVKCSSCGNVIDVYTTERPLIIECNKCGKKGRLGK